MNNLNKSLEVSFWPILWVILCLVLDILPVFENKIILSYRMGQKLTSKLTCSYLHQILMDFYTFYISQGSVATQLRCGGMFSKHFITNFPQNAPVKNVENRYILGKDMEKFVAYFFGPPCTCSPTCSPLCLRRWKLTVLFPHVTTSWPPEASTPLLFKKHNIIAQTNITQ